MKLKAIFPLLMMLMVSGCRAGEAQTPEDTGEMPYDEVDFAFFSPRALPACDERADLSATRKLYPRTERWTALRKILTAWEAGAAG